MAFVAAFVAVGRALGDSATPPLDGTSGLMPAELLDDPLSGRLSPPSR
ncbi:MAG: hypothetical protein ACRENI_02695 [Gemmatimonadaceae bacterium]